ncbi:hypothetical protein [Rhodanobacter sp. MP1X3]|jgi:hypothetical protein|uniref:hypothetical protein n=1 Tax=Rhodanobacter sp. MP1X3 TaxID=2723086 RepID=UPI00161AA87B|nr:hypothetical protein [Rhodanobacter sp. MP1X3]MBB6243812.1 hypothetical protein [Rhodanobacter sp. MP1X3]
MKTHTILRKRLMYSLLALLGGMLLLAPLWAQAQQVPVFSAADKQAIESYNLNEDNFKRLAAAVKEVHEEGISPPPPKDFSNVHSLDDLANVPVAEDKRILPLLQKYGFTPREFLVANFALANAGIAVQAKSNPEAAKYMDKNRINPANVSFYEAHEAQIAALQQQFEDGSNK